MGKWYNFLFYSLNYLYYHVGTISNYGHENYQLFQVDGKWYLLCTDYNNNSDGHWPYIYVMTSPGDWLHWSGVCFS